MTPAFDRPHRRRAAPSLFLVAALAVAPGCRCGEAAPGASARTSAARSAPAAASAGALRVARVTEPFKLDGELHEPAWNASAARSGAFTDAAGVEARPYSDARFLWDGSEKLYFGLYAADDDIRATVTAHDGPVWIDDAFSLRITPDGVPGAPTFQIDISANGVVTDVRRPPGGKDDPSWESGIALGVDRDGSVNDDKDDDEEWVIEAALPLRSLGVEPRAGTRLRVEISRCDTPKRTTAKRCGAFGTPGAPRVIELAP